MECRKKFTRELLHLGLGPINHYNAGSIYVLFVWKSNVRFCSIFIFLLWVPLPSMTEVNRTIRIFLLWVPLRSMTNFNRTLSFDWVWKANVRFCSIGTFFEFDFVQWPTPSKSSERIKKHLWLFHATVRLISFVRAAYCQESVTFNLFTSLSLFSIGIQYSLT